MWTATWALNTFVAKGKTTDWQVHMLGQAVGAHTDATHGMTLAAVSMAYYRYIMKYGLKKFARYAAVVWGVNADGKSDEEDAAEGWSEKEKWMTGLGLTMNLTELGVTPDMIDAIADSTVTKKGGYKALDKAEIKKILRESL